MCGRAPADALSMFLRRQPGVVSHRAQSLLINRFKINLGPRDAKKRSVGLRNPVGPPDPHSCGEN